MIWYIAAIAAILAGCRGQQPPQEALKEQRQRPEEPAALPQQPLAYYGGFQGRLPLQYDVRFLEQPVYAEKQVFPRLPQPQVFQFYPPPGQQFLLQPGAAPPPGNFLIPQPPAAGPGPEFVLRDAPPRPLFVAGYPKPAHVPPIEKDAEEIPTDPARVPKFPAEKPEKLETFNEDNGEQDLLAKTPTGYVPKKSAAGAALKPGQRFFVLNGQNLFNYPFQTYDGIVPQGIEPLKYQQESLNQIAGFEHAQYPFLLQQQGFYPGFERLQQEQRQQQEEKKAADTEYLVGGNISKVPLRYYQYETTRVAAEGDDSVVVDAKKPSGNLKLSTSTEPSISQAQPGAIALAGPGGVASAAPRGTALVGDGGLAVSSPQATAVAGPTRDEPQKKGNKGGGKKQ